MVQATRLLHFSKKFSRFYDHQFTALLEETGLSIREIHVLLFLTNNPGYDTARDVTEFRGLVKSQVSQAVELLCGRGLLTRTADPEDRRVVHLSLTAEGQALARRAQDCQSSCYTQLFRGFSPEEEQQFHALLARVLDNGDALDTKAESLDGSDRRNV